MTAVLASACACACGTANPSEPAPAVPRPIELDPQAQSESLIWRAAPMPSFGARSAVRRFFAAVAQESASELGALFTEDALFHRPNQPASAALMTWVRRLSAGDYTRQVVTKDIPVQLLDGEATDQLASRRSLHLLPQSGEYLAVVALPFAPGQQPALWGSELQLILLYDGAQWQIRELWEDYSGK